MNEAHGATRADPGIEAHLRRVLDAADVAVATLDAEGRILTATSAFAQHWRCSLDDVVGRHLVGLWPEERRVEITATMVRLVEAAAELEIIDTRSVDGAGRLRIMRTTLGRLPDDAGRTASLICALSDVTDSHLVQRRRPSTIELVREEDPTGSVLADPASVEPMLASATRRAARTGRALSVLCCEVSGLATGDNAEVLVELATRLSTRLRPSDALCRLGERTFVVVAEDLGDEQDAAGVAYRLLSAAVEPIVVDDAVVELGMTIGIVVADAAASPSRLLDTADSALCDARRDGVGSFRLVDLRTGLAA